MPRHFNDFVRAAPEAQPRMPLMHSTTLQKFRPILEDDRLAPSRDLGYGQDLLFFFYGRPAYRPVNDTVSTTQLRFYPVSLVIDADAVTTIERVLPLDSGAFHTGLFKSHLDGFDLMDFELEPSLEMAARVVGCFWRGSNEAYYWEKKFIPISIEPSYHHEAEGYQSLLSDEGLRPFDDRRRTVEIQTVASLDLAPGIVKAIVVPNEYVGNNPLLDAALQRWPTAKLRTYHTASSSPRDATELIFQTVHAFLSQYGSF